MNTITITTIITIAIVGGISLLVIIYKGLKALTEYEKQRRENDMEW